MRTKTSQKRNWLPILLLAIGMFSANALWAFTASFTYSIGSGGAVTFTSTSTGTTANTIYAWNLGDGSHVAIGSSLSTESYTYAYNGTYTVVLYISDSLAHTFDSAYTSIVISNSGTCNLHAAATGTVGATGLVNFSSSPSTGTNGSSTYFWSFGDGEWTTAQNPAYTYAANGTYYCQLTITNGYSCTSTTTDTVTITNANGTSCNLNASFTYTTGLNGQVNFTSTSTFTNAYTTYAWNPGDGGTLGFNNGSTYHHTYLANGTYTVSLSLDVDSGACHSMDTMVINVTNVTVPCNLSAAYTYTVSANGLVNFTSTSTNTNANTEYFWNAGDGSGTTLGTSTFSHTYLVQGYYVPKLIIEDSGSAYCIDSTAVYVIVSTADSNSCGLHAGFTYTMGANGHITFNSSSHGTSDSSFGYVYNWNTGDGNPTTWSNDSVYNYVYTANGTYTVVLSVTSGSYVGACNDTASIVVTVSNVTIPCTLSAAFTAINDTTTGMVNIVSTSTGIYAGTQYYWNPGDGSPTIPESSGNFNYTYTANGTYNGTLVIKNTGSAYCVDSINEPLNVSNVDSLHASFVNTYVNDTIGNYYYSFLSTSTGINNVTTYAWEPGDTTGGDTGVNMTTYSHQYKYPGVHTVTLSLWFTTYPIMPHKAPTSAGNDMYDFSTYSMQINVGSPAGVAIISDAATSSKLYPNPNNGAFKLEVNGVTGTQNATVEVSNILGELVYQTTASVSNGTIMKDINLTNITNGTYFVRVITSNTIYNTKTVINR